MCPLYNQRVRMKKFLASLACCLLFTTLPLKAQGPDLLPAPSLPETIMKRNQQLSTILVNDSLIHQDAEFNFCGQVIDMTSRERQRKLQREISSISRFSSTLMQRANFYFPIVEDILQEHQIPDDFKYLMVIESAMDPEARSNVGAAGLWQFMKGTAQDYGLRVDQRLDERFHIEKSTHAACRYLQDAYNKFGDWVATAQSYNIGQARIGNELNKQQVTEAIDLNLVEETNRYIYRILAAKIIFTQPKSFGMSEGILYYKKLRRR